LGSDKKETRPRQLSVLVKPGLLFPLVQDAFGVEAKTMIENFCF